METKPRARIASGLNWTVFGGVAALLLVWEAVSRALELRTDFLPAPSRIALELWRTPQFREHALATCSEVLIGLLAASALGISAAVLIGCRPGLYRIAAPLVSFLQQAPLLILAPLLVVWFGFGGFPEILLVVVVCAPPIAAVMASALASIPQDMIDLVCTSGAGWWRAFYLVHFPIGLPGLFRGLKIAVSLAVAAAATGEFVGASRGFGYLAIEGVAGMSTPRVFAGLAGLAGTAFVIRAALVLLQFALPPVAIHENRN